jgi:hypothetical protein
VIIIGPLWPEVADLRVAAKSAAIRGTPDVPAGVVAKTARDPKPKFTWAKSSVLEVRQHQR